jgi:hypothetical protein
MNYCTSSRKRLVITSIIWIVLIGALVTWAVVLRHNANQPPTIIVSEAQLQEEIDHKNTFYKSQNNGVDQQTLRSDATRQLAGDSLVYDYAKVHAITVTQSEIDTAYQQRVDTAGSEQQLLHQLDHQYGITEEQYRSNISLDILKGKVQSMLGKPLNTWLNEELPHYRVLVTKK